MRTVGVGAVVALLLMFSASPASADPDRLQLSHDGTTWLDDLATPLFTATMLVPAEQQTSRFFVRNTSPTQAQLAVSVLDRSPAGSELAQHLVVTVDTHQVTPDTSGCTTVLSGDVLAPGEVRRVDVRMAFEDVAGQIAQSSAARFDLLVQLTESTERASADLCPTEPESPEPEGPTPEDPAPEDPKTESPQPKSPEPGPGAGPGAGPEAGPVAGTPEADPSCRDDVAVVTGVGAAEDQSCPTSSLPDTGAGTNLDQLLGLGLVSLLLGVVLATSSRVVRRSRRHSATTA